MITCLSGEFTYSWVQKNGRAVLVLKQAQQGWVSFGTVSFIPSQSTYSLERRDSFCRMPADCEGQIAAPTCDGALKCAVPTALTSSSKELYTCSYVCLEYEDIRLRTGPKAPANGHTRMPVSLEWKGNLNPTELELVVDPPTAGEVRRLFNNGFVGSLDGWNGTYDASWHFIACDASVNPDCLGPVTLKLRQVGNSRILAQANLENVPNTGDAELLPCQVGGNMFNFWEFTSNYAVRPRTYSLVPMTIAWADRIPCRKYLPESDEYLELPTISRALWAKFSIPIHSFDDTSRSFDFEFCNNASQHPVTDDLVAEFTSPSDTAFSINWGGFAVSSAAGTVVRILELVTGEPLPIPEDMQWETRPVVPITRLAMTWEKQTFGSTLVQRGCLLYDSKHTSRTFK